MLDYYGYSSKYQEVKTWYNGYRFGNTMRSITPGRLLTISSIKEADAYWVDTGENALCRITLPKEYVP